MALSACSGGGSGAVSSVAAIATSTTSASPSPSITPIASVSALQEASLHGASSVLALGSTPNFSTSPPSIGTVFPFSDTVALIMPISGSKGESVTPCSLSPATTLTYQGTQTINGVTKFVFELKQPALSLDAPNMTGSTVTLVDGRKATLGLLATLNYVVLGWWSQLPNSNAGESYFAWGATGYQTPLSGVPASGSASYAGGGSAPGGVYGDMYFPSSGFVANAFLHGEAKVDVNFTTGGITGAFSNMTAGIAGDDAPAQSWNSVALSGNLSGATMRGTTAAANAPNNTLSMSSGASGTFSGALFGPNGQELGLTWTLYDPSGNGKTAFGIAGATAP